MKFFSYFLTAMVLMYLPVMSQIAIKASFETPIYAAGNVNGQGLWTITTGNATISNAKSKSGTNSLNFSNTSSALLANYNAYSGSVTGIREVFYTEYVD